jgi:hypothetical protein
MIPKFALTYFTRVVAGLCLTGLEFCVAIGFTLLLCLASSMPISRISLSAAKDEQSGAQYNQQFPHFLPPQRPKS